MPPPLINRDGTFNSKNEWLQYWASRITPYLTFPQWMSDWLDKMERARKNSVAKAYRQTPLIGADDSTGLPVQMQRQRKAGDLLARMVARFPDEFILHVATEVGLDECITYAEDGKSFIFDITPLQMVSLGAALAACAEYRDAMQTTKREVSKPKRRKS